MHVGIFIPNLHGGGAEFVTRRWVVELHELGHKVSIYVYDRAQPPVDLPTTVTLYRFDPAWRGARHLMLPIWLHRRVTTSQPDVLLSMLTYSNVVALLMSRIFRHSDLPLVVSERNMPSLEYARGRKRDRVTSWIARRLYRNAEGVLAISHPVAGDLVSAYKVPPERLYVVPNPVIADTGTRHRQPPEVSPDRLHIAFVGRLVDQKRPSLFLSVLDTLAHRDIEVRGTVIGDGPLRQQTEDEALKFGLDVTFAGWHEPWWENAAAEIDCILLTARFEGLANVLVEAAAAGIPSVACSRALGVADAILPGLTGELTVTDHPTDYANAVVRACSRVHSTNELQDWLAHFSTAHSTATLLVALQAACEQSRA